jgi:ATPase subunit of ABC transporter with duplicated ATPase domains
MHRPGALAARSLTKLHGDHVVLDGVSLVVPPHARIGVVGPNGIGKSTLLRLLAGLELPDGGELERGPGLTVGYLPQEPDVRADEALLAYLARRTAVAEAGRALDALAARLGSEPELADEHAEALDRFLSLGGGDLEARAGAAVAAAGLTPGSLGAPLGTFSGGQAARASLAAILLTRFDVLLLDEPTNDLDFAGLALLERFLAGTIASVVLVSHDRELLDRVATRVVELRPGGEAREYAGGYADFERARGRERRGEYEAWEGYVSERGRLEEQARRRADWAARATTQRRKKKTRDIRGQVRRELERLDRAEKPHEPWELRLRLRADQRGSEVVARLAHAVVERNGFRLGPLDLELRRGERLAIVGSNGSGKSTLLGVLLGRHALTLGESTIDPSVVSAELDQDRAAFAGPDPLLTRFTRLAGLRGEDARTLLAKFGLGAGGVTRACASLSPGERTRAALALFAAKGANLLVLDEPTNHLDIEAIEQLEAALADYDGTLVAVSHDRRFLERLAPTRTLDLSAAP